METQKYKYNAFVNRVIDGDTIEVTIDFGFNFKQEKVKFRLYGVDTPEVYGVKKDSEEYKAGMEASAYMRLIVGNDVVIETIKDKKGKYGRYLAIVWFDGLNMNEELVKRGLAKEYML